MKRRQLIEFHDMSWFPAGIRDVFTDYMSWFAIRFHVFRPVVPMLRQALLESASVRIIDLCSGAGGPSVAIAGEFEAAGSALPPIVLTDKFPNRTAFRRIESLSGGALSFVDQPVDATNVPALLYGFRTLYASFHHFHPSAARAIIHDAVSRREGIGIFEYTERNLWIWGLPMLLTPLLVLLSMPFVRPFKWKHFLWTYLVPIVPIVSAWDGLVSCLRTYSAAEMLELAAGAAAYRWDSGRVRAFGSCHVTYLIGCPQKSDQH